MTSVEPGSEASSPSSSSNRGTVYHAHLCIPVKGKNVKGPWRCLFRKPPKLYMSTEASKLKKAKKAAKFAKALKSMKSVKKKPEKPRTEPVIGKLRPENIIGGGFYPTASGAVSKFGQEHVADQAPVSSMGS